MSAGWRSSLVGVGLPAWALVVCLSGCLGDPPTAGGDAGGADSGTDGMSAEASGRDARGPEAASPDAASEGSAPRDGGLDARGSDAADAGGSDVGASDAGVADVGVADVGGSSEGGDAGVGDASGTVDAGPSGLVFAVAPQSARIGVPLPPIQVNVTDGSGARVPSAANQVTLAIARNAGGATLLGTLSAVAVGGQAFFDTVGLDQPGTGYTLVASSPGLASATSAAFDMTAPPFARVSTGLYGGIVQSVAVAGGAQPAVYAGTPAGVFKSTNNGGTWALANFGNAGEADLVVVDPKTPSTLYITPAFGAGSYGYRGFAFAGKSTNGGGVWSAVAPNLGVSQIGTFAIDPVDTAILYAGGPQGLYRSTDGGGTWTNTAFAYACYALAVDPVTTSILYASAYDTTAGYQGIYKSIDSGATWGAVNNPSLTTADLRVQSLFTTPTGVFAIASQVYRSADGGASWTGLGFTGTAVAYAPSNVMRVYVAGPRGTIEVSNDGGATFTAAGSLGGPANAIAVDPASADHVFGATGNGVLVSSDGGVTWTASSVGISELQVGALAMNPAAPSTVFAGAPDGIYRTTDTGTSWSHFTGATQVTALAIDPANAQNVYGCTLGATFYRSVDGGGTWNAGVSTGGGSYCYTIAVHGQTIWVPTVGGGVRLSLDGGQTWAATGLTAASYGVAADPTGAVVYAATNTGTYKSIDGGLTWNVMVSTDLGSAMLVDPLTASTIYAGMSCGSSVASSTTTGSGGVKVSTDSGGTWGAAVGAQCVDALLGLPSGNLFAVGRGTLFLASQDHGATWTAGGDGIVGEALAVAATSDSKTVYVGSRLGLFKSTTGGF